MTIDDKVYTIHATTRSVDEWVYIGKLNTPTETLLHLTDGKQTMFIPERCVYATKEDAYRVLSEIFFN